MKKYFKRKFLPPDHQKLLYHKYENCKQLGNSVFDFTNEFYRLRSYIDLNEPEASNISRYMMGLRCAIRERLSSRSFCFLSDLVLAAEAIEQLLEWEKTMKWKPQTIQNTTTDDVKYPGVSATENYSSVSCNPKETTSTLSSKVFGGEKEYGSNKPA